MIFESPRMTLKVIRIVHGSDANDIYVCQDISSQAGVLYTLVLIKQHSIVHSLLKIFEDFEKDMEEVCVEYFSVDDSFAIVFPYLKERPLSRFYLGNSYDLAECESICINLVINLMTNSLPFPVMYLAIKQGQLNIAKDRSIYLGYQIDLAELNEKVGERECVEETAKIVLNLLESKKDVTDVMTYDLINKKIERHSYSVFTELYKDIRIAAVPSKKRGRLAALRAWFRRNKDQLFKVLLVIAVVLGIFVALSFLTNVFFGDIPWLRFFFGGFKHIGTEYLNK